ncbi:adenylyltransferase/cytidyltransferase family protein [Staphylococcus chromogenes]|nr:adenylyltransferase/cytidyltransferase family protein [Staphylococcus chromogenes]
MKRVITYGTYDLLHYGHIELLRRAREMGDYLVVALSSDEFNPVSYTHLTLPTIREMCIRDSDWEGEFDFLKDKCEVIYLKRTEGISTTQIKKELYGKDAK